jgi:hypothetical protein
VKDTLFNTQLQEMQKYSEMSQELHLVSKIYIFRIEPRAASCTLKSVIDDLSIWLYRFKHRDHKVAAWISYEQ